MSTALLPKPELIDSDTDDQWCHRFCCDPTTALCGFVVPTGVYVEYEDCDDDCDLCCEMCTRLDDYRCPVDGCTSGVALEAAL